MRHAAPRGMASGDDGGTHVIELGTVGGGSDHGAIAPNEAGGRGGSTPTGGDCAPVAVSASSSATSFDGNGVAHRCGSQSLSAGGAWLRFRDISFGVHTPDGGYKRILDGVSGAAKPGCVLFLMGPSGAGKSSLLDALADRVKLRVTGGVTVDGEPKDELTFKTVAKYVQQDDVLSAALTTHETLLYYARMYCPWDEAEARERARAAMGAMGLDDQADTKIGGLLFRGLSGGQKRRVSVGVQLVARPRIIFLDEPTSGLDSAAALHVVRSLNEVAKTLGTTTVLTIHQPGEKVFDLSNGLLLLSGGRTAYFGLTANAVDHFTGLGHKVPPLTSGAEWMLDLVDTSFQEHETVDEILDAYDSSEAKQLLDAVLSTGKGDAVDTALKESEARGFQAPLWTLLTAGSSSDSSILWQTLVLSRLMLVNVVRNPAYMWLRFAMVHTPGRSAKPRERARAPASAHVPGLRTRRALRPRPRAHARGRALVAVHRSGYHDWNSVAANRHAGRRHPRHCQRPVLHRGFQGVHEHQRPSGVSRGQADLHPRPGERHVRGGRVQRG